MEGNHAEAALVERRSTWMDAVRLGDPDVYAELVTPDVHAHASGSHSEHRGAYALIWQHCGDGRWRIDRYFDTTAST